MTSRERMKKDLIANIKFVSVLYGLTLILFVYKLYQLFWADVTNFDINSRLIFGDYFVITLLIVGTVTFIYSFVLLKILPEKKIATQHTILLVSGVLLLPYSLVILVTGFKIGLDNRRYESKNTIFAFGALMLFIIFYGYLLVGFAGITPNYTHSKTYEIEYRFDDYNHITYTVEVVYKDDELLFVDLEANATIQELIELDPTLQQLAYVLEGNNEVSIHRLCSEIVSTGDAIVNENYTCRTTLDEYPGLELTDVDEFSDFMLIAIFQDKDFVFDYEYLNITLLNETYKDNYYE